MPKLIHKDPKYQHHRASGQAVVTLDGKDFYLGVYGTKSSKREYDRLVGEFPHPAPPPRFSGNPSSMPSSQPPC
jgi:hypothetical protein